MRKVLILFNLCIISFCSGCSMSKEDITNELSKMKSISQISEDNVIDENCEETLCNDLFSKKFKLEEKIYSIPIKVKELQEEGWRIQDNSLKLLKSGEKNSFVILENKGKIICISIENNNSRDMYIEDCIINGVLVQKSEEIQTKINLPGNITIGSSNQEVESAFRDIINDDDIRQSEDVINYVYCKDGFSVSIIVDKATDKVFCISLSEI